MLRSIDKFNAFIPQRRVPLRNDPRGPIGLECSHLPCLMNWDFEGVEDASSLFPKGEFLKELYRGVPLVECYHYLDLLVSKFYSLEDAWKKKLLLCRRLGWVGLGRVRWAYLPPKFFRCEKISFKNIFFFKCV